MSKVLFVAEDGVHGAELWETNTATGETTLVKNINPNDGTTTPGSEIGPIIVINHIAYFSAFDGVSALLWRSDGTAAGTYAITTDDFGGAPTSIAAIGGVIYFLGSASGHNGLFRTDGTPGGASFVANVSGSALTVLNGKLIFNGSDAAHGSELWVSDGTPPGTTLLKDLNPGTGSTTLANYTVMDGKLYFTATQGNDTELWATDGTPQGTVQLTTATSGPAPAPNVGSTSSNIVALNGHIYFGSGLSTSIHGLFSSDGTPGGETEVANGFWIRGPIFKLGSQMLFTGSQSQIDDYQVQLYVSDGTAAGTRAITGPGFSLTARTGVVAGSKFYFVAQTKDSFDSELWVTDGTTVGTHVVRDINGQSIISKGDAASGPANLTAVGSSVLFSANDGVHGRELWISDGTAAGTHLVLDLNPTFDASTDGPTAGGYAVSGSLVSAGSLHYFISGDQVFATDGTLAGTHVAVPEVFINDVLLAGPAQLTGLGNSVYFTESNAAGYRLYRYDPSSGAAAITPLENIIGIQTPFQNRLIVEARATSSDVLAMYSVDPSSGAMTQLFSGTPVSGSFYDIGGKLLFAAPVGTSSATGLYVTDGTAAGTFGLTAPDAIGQYNKLAGTVVGGQLFFTGIDNHEWVSDGSVPGTHALLGATAYSTYAGAAYAFGGGVVWEGVNSDNLAQVWFSDGTNAGTRLLAEIDPITDRTGSLDESALVKVGDKTYFIGKDPSRGYELYVTDGTIVGTHVLTAVELGLGTDRPGSAEAFGSSLIFTRSGGGLYIANPDGGHATLLGTMIGSPLVLGDKVYFVDYDGLHSSNGTTGSNSIVSTVHSSGLQHIFALDGGVVFEAYTNGGIGAYRYDPNTATTALLTSIQNSFGLSGAVSTGNKLYFIGNDGVHGNEIWGSDGTAAGTLMLTDAEPGSGSGWASDITRVGSKVYFTSGGDSGAHTYVTDGTAAGTLRLATGGDTAGFVSLGGKTYFTTLDASTGTQLWTSDGTQAGTHAVATLVAGSAAPAIRVLTPIGDHLYFSSGDGLWTSDGAAGTQLFTGISVDGIVAVGAHVLVQGRVGGVSGFYAVNGAGSYQLLPNIQYPAGTVGGLALFSGTDAANGQELWVTDGTVAGTHRLTDTGSPIPPTTAGGFVSAGGKLFFVANDATHGSELYVLDSQGTHMVKDISAGAGSGITGSLVAAGGNVFFGGFDFNGGGQTLWVSDGTTAGTQSIAGIAPASLTAFGAQVVFKGGNSNDPTGVFISDGTAAGTHLLTSEDASNLHVVDGKLYFTGFDRAHGLELWVSDGTVAGTHPLTDTETPNGSNPSGFAVLSAPLTPLDLDGDGHSDLLWRNDNGSVIDWASSHGDGLAGYQGLGSISTDWHIAASGDFDGDCKADVLWRNDSGLVGTWDSTLGTGGSSYQTIGYVPDALWQVVGTGDLDGDGKSDVLWRYNQGETIFWSSKAGGGASGYTDLGYVGPDWKIAGIADFDGDGKADILWRNTDGSTVLWDSHLGQGAAGYSGVGDVSATYWSVAATADFSGDGKADILWRGQGGEVYLWSSQAGPSTGFDISSLGNVGNDWHVQSALDLNGDGRADILWRNDNGDVAGWLSQASGGYQFHDYGIVGADWHLAGG